MAKLFLDPFLLPHKVFLPISMRLKTSSCPYLQAVYTPNCLTYLAETLLG